MSDIGHETATLASLDDSDCLGLAPPFTLQELGAVLRDLHYGKAADADGTVAEMFKYSSIPLQTCLLDIYNSMIASGSVVETYIVINAPQVFLEWRFNWSTWCWNCCWAVIVPMYVKCGVSCIFGPAMFVTFHFGKCVFSSFFVLYAYILRTLP